MTAQIAILNKHGIALATDSAVTITGNDNQKVYNTANKLFSLSNKFPVGIMIYGSAQFMGVPWETIVKSYRRDLKDISFDSLEEYCSDFVEYIMKNDILQQNFAFESTLYQTLTIYLKIILNQVNSLILTYAEQERTPELVGTLIDSAVNHLTTVVGKIPFNEGFDEGYVERNLDSLNNDLDSIIDRNIFVEVSLEGRNNIKKLLINLLAKDFYTDATTGIVIAGYGNNNIFPALYEYKFEGIFSGVLKFKLESKEIISAEATEDSTTASIKAFAQKEMVHTFIEGIDPFLYKEMFDSIYSLLLESYPKILTENLGISLNNDEEQRLSILSNEIFNEIRTNVRNYQNSNYTWPIIDTIQLMPKEEIATVAETLLNLASLKKRVTMDTESVGGPIDVAIISKNDGLIWIKRKHYFNPELNYRYFDNNK
ncbi:MAG: hypothetical protein ACQET8_02150 [Bacillota bacterium]